MAELSLSRIGRRDNQFHLRSFAQSVIGDGVAVQGETIDAEPGFFQGFGPADADVDGVSSEAPYNMVAIPVRRNAWREPQAF